MSEVGKSTSILDVENYYLYIEIYLLILALPSSIKRKAGKCIMHNADFTMSILEVFVIFIFQMQCCNSYSDQNVVSVYGATNVTNYTDVTNIAFPMENFTVQFYSKDFHLNSVLTIANRSSVTVK